MTRERLQAILRQLVDENPFAIRAFLKISTLEITDAVPTLAVSLEARPRLKVNLGFVTKHCQNDAEVEAVLCHEFLHVVLAHTERFEKITPELHLALDAVVNAIIHRQLGPSRSSMMSRYYGRSRGLLRLLRPMTEAERERLVTWNGTRRTGPSWVEAWGALYAGWLVVDDIRELAMDLVETGAMARAGKHRLIGNHDDLPGAIPQELADVLDQSMREMNGSGIWRSPKDRGVGANPYDALVRAADDRVRRWEDQAYRVLRQHLLPDPTSRNVREEPREMRLPVLTPGDRRGFLRALTSPFLPDCVHGATRQARDGTAQVYLDVSGSMDAEMPLVIAVLGRLSRAIRRPFWAFSDEVAPAVIREGRLETRTSGGTSLTCVLAHLERTRPAAAVIVTDGYVEELPPDCLARVRATRVHALVTRDGNPAALQRAGIPYTQLERLPR